MIFVWERFQQHFDLDTNVSLLIVVEENIWEMNKYSVQRRIETQLIAEGFKYKAGGMDEIKPVPVVQVVLGLTVANLKHMSITLKEGIPSIVCKGISPLIDSLIDVILTSSAKLDITLVEIRSKSHKIL